MSIIKNIKNLPDVGKKLYITAKSPEDTGASIAEMKEIIERYEDVTRYARNLLDVPESKDRRAKLELAVEAALEDFK